jgi:hypothetical protein
VIVRVGLSAKHIPDENISYSLDEGLTWQGTAATPAPGSRLGTIAVSSDGKTWVWTPDGARSYFTRDRGKAWAPSSGLPANLRVISGPIASQSFYALCLPDQTLFRSTDGAATFRGQRFALFGGPLAIGQSLRGDPFVVYRKQRPVPCRGPLSRAQREQPVLQPNARSQRDSGLRLR